jgi:glycosyltransferase involved in cell wall biosynthesis
MGIESTDCKSPSNLKIKKTLPEVACIPKVSVVIPLYNKESSISRTLNSILNQTVDDFEVIVVNDGSTDNSLDIVKKFDDPRIHLIQQQNQGVSAARNRGVEAAEGKLIAFLDADDEWLPIFLEKILYLYDKYPAAGLLILGHQEFEEMINDKPKYSPILNSAWEGILPSYFVSVTFDHYLVCTGSIGVPKDILNETGLFKEGVSWGEDEDLWGRIALKYPVAYSSQLGTIIHFMESDINRLKVRMVSTQVHPFISEVQKRISEKKVPDFMVNDLSEYVALLQIRSATHNLDIGNKGVARNILKKCSTNCFKNDRLWLFAWSFVPSKLYGNRISMKFRELLGGWLRRRCQLKTKIPFSL